MARPQPRLMLLVLAAFLLLGASHASAVSIESATSGQDQGSTPEISTEELRLILLSGSATVIDARSRAEYDMGHIPGARSAAAKPADSTSVDAPSVAEVSRVVKDDKKAPIVLYGNGPFGDESRRLADKLKAAGFTNVRRYQLGVPVWRALGGPCEMAFQSLWSLLQKDHTAVVIDAREASEFKALSLPGTHNIPRSLVREGRDVGEIKKAKQDGRLPMDDRNTRVVVLASDGASARYVAGALMAEGFQNVSYLDGSFAQTKAAGDSLPK